MCRYGGGLALVRPLGPRHPRTHPPGAWGWWVTCRQAGATTLSTALFHVPAGEVWPMEAILERQQVVLVLVVVLVVVVVEVVVVVVTAVVVAS